MDVVVAAHSLEGKNNLCWGINKSGELPGSVRFTYGRNTS